MNDLKKAISEQQAADKILATIDRVNHFKMLEKKFGPKTRGIVVFTFNDGTNERLFSQKKFLDNFIKGLAREAQEIDPNFKDKPLKDVIKSLSKNAGTRIMDEA